MKPGETIVTDPCEDYPSTWPYEGVRFNPGQMAEVMGDLKQMLDAYTSAPEDMSPTSVAIKTGELHNLYEILQCVGIDAFPQISHFIDEKLGLVYAAMLSASFRAVYEYGNREEIGDSLQHLLREQLARERIYFTDNLLASYCDNSDNADLYRRYVKEVMKIFWQIFNIRPASRQILEEVLSINPKVRQPRGNLYSFMVLMSPEDRHHFDLSVGIYQYMPHH